MENVEFCTLVLSSGSHVALSQHLLSFLIFNLRDSPAVISEIAVRVVASVMHQKGTNS